MANVTLAAAGVRLRPLRLSDRVEWQRLREANAELVVDLLRFTGMSHREVNGRLNRLAGVERVTEATLEQLRRRADQAERWLASL